MHLEILIDEAFVDPSIFVYDFHFAHCSLSIPDSIYSASFE